MFVIKYDKVSMIRLVQCIEQQPAIYDSKNHYSKDAQDTAWDIVARTLGEKDSLCRDRWHSIKSCYIRHLKYTAINSKRKPYYLAEYLDFLLPHVTERLQTFLASKMVQLNNLPSYLKEALPNVPKPESAPSFLSNVSGLSNVQDLVIKEELVDVEEVSDYEWLNVTPDIISQPSSSKKKKSPKRLPTNQVTKFPKKVKTLKIEEPTPRPPEDDDIVFFKSLLPEIRRMSSHQKLKFKQEALSIIEDILYATEEVEDINTTE